MNYIDGLCSSEHNNNTSIQLMQVGKTKTSQAHLDVLSNTLCEYAMMPSSQFTVYIMQ